MSGIRKVFVSIIAFALLLAAWRSAYAQSADVKFFPETGHNIRGEFLKFYNNTHDPILVYGYPITEQFVSRDGKTVQYFQRARFEVTASGALALTPIGRALHQPATPLDAKNPLACQSFNGVPVCYAFLDFYKANGGAAQFGNPVAPAEQQGSLFAQYFEYARFEWRANNFQNRVVITDLGRIYFDVIKEDPSHRNPVTPQDATINPVLSLRAHAFVAKSVTRSSGAQTVSVLVQSQTMQPVANANGSALVRLPDGATQTIAFATNQFGVAQFSFDFANLPPGELVTIEITVKYLGLETTTKTSFRVWY
ncbi:MAG: carboxypeptidase regulatory-like domain-containing protein [Anaerolineales bacterium]|nr:carboxypeptidase regulatory-like domain-containing protein [Anaerolineales bacterium]